MNTLVAPLTVEQVEPLTPRMTRVTFTGDGLSTLETWPDQQLKLLFPPKNRPLVLPAAKAEGDGMSWYLAYQSMPVEDRPTMRSFTVRSLADGRMTIDFVLHEHGGPASTWARTAAPGDVLGRYGPAEAYRQELALDASWVLLAGDETALPAIGSLLPRPGAKVLVEVADEAEEQPLPGVTWLHRNKSPHGQRLTMAVENLEIPPGSAFAWLAGEATMVRALRRSLVAKGLPKTAIEFTGYWRARLTQDDAPTEADMADAQERIAMSQ
ncbi:siderophore-interacting protein [Actinophytocola oryzae]|uniref:NADPH-dependent ferric siderophore reductase n=1 Tax=Actinophytocola oryzae TaxID=502181 RepID=A0A4R7VBA0_9PSEU|nr:siderophore-interacting protein [Actinophytocola oryzae]TDV46314.1 NADPH-dependent ferric siderophore reductase [Actinophytocola oryzae]